MSVKKEEFILFHKILQQMLGVYTHFFQFRAAVASAIQTVRSFTTGC